MDDREETAVGENLPETGEGVRIPNELPVLPLKDTIVYPFMIVPLAVGRPKSVKLVDEVIVKDKLLALVAQREKEEGDPRPSQLYEVGTAASILRFMRLPDDTMRILVQGLARIRITHYTKTDPYLVAKVERLESVVEDSVELQALTRNASSQFQAMVSMLPQFPEEMKVVAAQIDDPSRLADVIAANLNISTEEKQKLLETLNVKERLERVTRLLARDVEVLELGQKIQTQVKNEIDKGQREYFLRQQLKAIQEELGEGDERQREIKEIKEKLEAAKLPAEAKKEAERELDRLAKMPPQASEYSVSRTYLDWLCELPWSKSTRDRLDIRLAESILNEDHYDLEKVKERILEHLAVLKLKPGMKGPILCFVGPPGTGKTSVGRSIARALGRKFIRLSLGGVRDEAEIRGHRRTYVGALPGRIIQGIRKAGSNNPVMMLDEIDKLGQDFRGDPSSALLEVLDPEQNYSFSDHYLEVPFDLSKVMFITTANILDTIPPALLDRMEVLELPGYTSEEKVHIAKKFLIPKQLEEHGITAKQLKITDAAVRTVIEDYTREAGVRNLERNIATICRKVAREIAAGKSKGKRVDQALVRKMLGPKRFYSEVAERTSEPGVATGLAVTQAGGDILFIESIRAPGQLTLTGSLGDIMKESAQAALSYVRANAPLFGISAAAASRQGVHVHVPAGAIPKDGPSAGIAIACSIISLLSGRPVRPDVAMTGEITLRGKVLRVGGIKEKCLAAKRAGIKTVILPKQNKPDVEEIPQQIRDHLRFKFVDKIEDVLSVAFTPRKHEKRSVLTQRS